MMRRIHYIVGAFFFAISLASFPIYVIAGTVTDFTDQPSSVQISALSNHKFTFTTTSTIAYDSVITITFPSTFTLSSLVENDVDLAVGGIDYSTSADCLGSDNLSVAISGQLIVITVCNGDGGTIVSGSVVTIEVGQNASASGLGSNRITNPSALGSFFINLTETGGNSGSVIFTTTTVGGPTVSATVPASGGSGGGGGGGGGASPSTPDPDPEPDPEPTEPIEDPVPAEDPVTIPEMSDDEDSPDSSGDSGTTDYGQGESDSSSSGGSTGTDSDTSEESAGGGSDGGADTVVDAIDVPEEEGTVILPEPSNEVGTDEEDAVDDVTVPPSSSGQDSAKPDKKTTSLPTTSSVFTAFTERIQAVSESLESIRALPEVQTAVDIAIPITVVTAVSTTAVLATSFNLLSYLQFIFTSPLLFVARRKRKAYGIVYNSATKVAVDLAIVRLYHATSRRLVKSVVTDREGKYFFVVDPGQYHVTVTKGGYIFPSTDLAGVKDDGVFLDVYTGQTIEVTEHDATIAANIPLDIAQGQKAQEPKHIARRKLLRKIQFVCSLSGSLLSIAVYVFSPTFMTLIFALVQCIVFLLFRRLAIAKKPRGWGVVYDASTRRPVGNAVVRLFEPKYNKLVETTLTDTLGRYSFLVGPNEYFVSTNREGYEERIVRPIDYRERREPEPLAIDVPLDPKTS